jgi:hypothetical protein
LTVLILSAIFMSALAAATWKSDAK